MLMSSQRRAIVPAVLFPCRPGMLQTVGLVVLITFAFGAKPVAAQGFPVCAVANTESIGDLQPGGAYVVATSANTARANAVCDALVNVPIHAWTSPR
jgi:hypothetical protein